MAHTPLVLVQFDGDATYDDSGAGGTGTETGAVRYREGHDPAVMAALVEEGTVNWIRNPSVELAADQPSFEGTWGFTGSASRQRSVEQASDGTLSGKFAASTVNSGAAIPANIGLYPAASNGQTWSLSADLYGASGDVKLTVVERASDGANLANHDGPTIALTPAWARHDTTATLANGSTTTASSYIRTVSGAVTFYADRVQLEQKDHATTYCPEWDGAGFLQANLLPGYTALIGTDNNFQYYQRAAAKIEIPTAAPTWVACRYSEDLGATWQFAYITTFSGNNVGTYGKISHSGGNLVIESDRALLVGPLYAGTGSLDVGEQAALDSEPDWTFGMSLSGSDAPVVNAGANATIVESATFTRTVSFTDADSSSWTATVDYGEGAGPVAATVDQENKTVALSNVYESVGTYTVTVTVDDGAGGVGSDTVQVSVVEGLLTGGFTVSPVVGTHPTAPRITLP